jgi:hypothetical protein
MLCAFSVGNDCNLISGTNLKEILISSFAFFVSGTQFTICSTLQNTLLKLYSVQKLVIVLIKPLKAEKYETSKVTVVLYSYGTWSLFLRGKM